MYSKQTSSFRVNNKSASDDTSQGGASIQCNWRLTSEHFIDSIIATADKKSMLKNKYTAKEREERQQQMDREKSKGKMEFPNYSQRRDWRTLQQKTKESVNMLIRITEHLEKVELDKTTDEVTKYLHCSGRLTKLIPGMVERLVNHFDNFVLEKENFCESLSDPMSEESRTKSCNSGLPQTPKQVQQKVQDIFTNSMTQHIVAPTVSPRLPVLTPRTGPTRSQGAQVQAKHQFMGQQLLFPYPPPPMQPSLPPLQMAQEAPGYPKRIPKEDTPNGELQQDPKTKNTDFRRGIF